MKSNGTWSAVNFRGDESLRRHPLPQRARHHDSPGSLTKNLALCELCYLRVWRKNRAAFPSQATGKLMESSARRAMSLAFVDGTRAEFRAAWRLARAQLSGPLRVFYVLAPPARPLLRTAIRLKRRWVWRRA